jgi:predicted dehydrogenase
MPCFELGRDYRVVRSVFEAGFHFLFCEIPVPRYLAAQRRRAREDRVAKRGVLGISFDHMHMGDLLRQVADQPDAEIAGIFDPDRQRMASAIATFGIPEDRVFTDLHACLTKTRADLAIVCSATAEHANTVETIAPHGLHVVVEKPFAASVANARRMIKAMEATGKRLAVNWPLAWYPSHNTAKRLVAEGAIGDLIEVHFYDGNRGPLYHLADKVEVSPAEVEAAKPGSWWYRKASGGGSLLDYLGYGTTLGSWFMDGEAPLEVTSIVDETPGIEVDQHSITVCRYRRGLSKFETRWGTLTDPWTQQPQPRCGFVLVGSDGSISSYDYDSFVTLQTRRATTPVQVPADVMPVGHRGPIEYMLARIEDGAPIGGPLDPALCLLGQRMIDSAVLSSTTKRSVPLVP